MANNFLSWRAYLMAAGLCSAWLVTGAAQTPGNSPSSAPAERFCVAPHARGGVGSGSGIPGETPRDEVTVVFTQSEVTKKAEILFVPGPGFTGAEASNVNGQIKLRVVLCPRGFVSNIKLLSKLPDNVSEKAVQAAQQIRFIPAEKDGKRVAQFATVGYEIY